MIGLTNLRTSGPPPMAPKLNHRRALFVLEKIDEILHWERTTERERDTRFVELGRYLCEIRAGQYWRVDNLKSFDEFLEQKFPESRSKAYYLMAIHEQLPRRDPSRPKGDGMDQGPGAGQSRASEETELRLCTLGAQGERDAEGGIQTGSGETPDREGERAVGDALFQGLQEPTGGHRAGTRDRFVDARRPKGAGLLSRDDLRGFSGRREPGRLRQLRLSSLGAQSNLHAAPELPAAGVLAADPEGVMNSRVSRQPRLRLDRDSYRVLCQKVLERDSWRCQQCGTSKDLQVHHIQPRSQLGGDVKENLITLCSRCHRRAHLHVCGCECFVAQSNCNWISD